MATHNSNNISRGDRRKAEIVR